MGCSGANTAGRARCADATARRVVYLDDHPQRLAKARSPGVGITLRVGRVNLRAEMPDCIARVAAGHFHPEHVITRRVRFEDAHEAIGDPTIRIAFVRDGIE